MPYNLNECVFSSPHLTPQGQPHQHLALPLLLLVAQQRHVIATQTESRHVKLIVEMYDKCQETAKQYTRCG